MDNVKLEWEKFDDIKEIGKNDDTKFYAFTQNFGLKMLLLLSP